MVPLRDDVTKRLVKSFRQAMSAQVVPMTCIDEGTLDGEDDWDEDAETTIRCWWGIFVPS